MMSSGLITAYGNRLPILTLTKHCLIWFGLLCLTLLSTIFQFYWWREP